MIPIGDDNRARRRTPVVVYAIIVLNVVVFLYELSLQAQGGDSLGRFIYSWGAIPLELAHMEDFPPSISLPIWATGFSSMFIHGGWLHIIGNMLFLWVFGDNVEDALGHARFIIFYLICGIGAVALQVLVDTSSTQPMVGASGAISGVLAAYLVLFPHGRVRVLIWLGIFVTVISLPALIVIGFWIVLQFISGFASVGPDTAQAGGVAYFAHIGGFITGLVAIWLFRNHRPRRARYRR
ncbi:MAG: rhomboid family intramembrane serine protease [Thermomicrobiales bacterium]|nr:rhomboid family intramembrane serine protease [Thermomicrobiales bacterium]